MATAAPSSQFSGKSHYEVLGVSTDATQDQIKKAYRAMALKFHPDRNSSASAHHDMIAISRAADTLSDPVKRARYDEDGADGLDDESMGGNVDAAMEYWRAVYKKVTAEEITSFELSYRLSSDERVDVLKAYVTTKGDMNQCVGFLAQRSVCDRRCSLNVSLFPTHALLRIMMSVPCCVEADIERFADMIDAAILHGEVEKFRKFPASKYVVVRHCFLSQTFLDSSSFAFSSLLIVTETNRSKVTCFQEFAGEAQEIEEIKQTQGKVYFIFGIVSVLKMSHKCTSNIAARVFSICISEPFSINRSH